MSNGESNRGARADISVLNRDLFIEVSSRRCDVEKVARCLDLGADVNAVHEISGGGLPSLNSTCLLVCVENCFIGAIGFRGERRQVVDLLLDRGADPNQRGKHGERPLGLLIRYSDREGAREVACSLLRHGARVDVDILASARKLEMISILPLLESAYLNQCNADAGCHVRHDHGDGGLSL